jgi:AAA domain
MKEMKNIHAAVLKHLLDKQEKYFLLETNPALLNKGYWFRGKEGLLFLSFWDRWDWRNNTPSIYFEINVHGRCTLKLVDDGGEKGLFFKFIADILDVHQIKDSLLDGIWFKNYATDQFLKHLNEFLKKDKPVLDALMVSNGKQNLFPRFQVAEFERNLNRIQKVESVLQEVLPIRLKKLVLKNITHFKSLEINLDKQVTCLIGDNGSGKTAILRALALGLAGVSNNALIKPDKLQKILRIKRVEGNRPVFEPHGQIEVAYNDKHERNIIHFNHQAHEIADNDGKVFQDYIQIDDTMSDATATDGNAFTHLVIGFGQAKGVQHPKSVYAEGDQIRPSIQEVLNLIYNQPDETLYEFLGWLRRLWKPGYSAAQIAGRKIVTQVFEVIQKIVVGRFELLPLVESDDPQLFIKTNEVPTGIPIELLSQGYNNVIGWIGYFMQRLWQVTPADKKDQFLQTHAVCLIDEIDTHLHPKWQQNILSILAKSFPNTQFVVTTHSPIVITHLENPNQNQVTIYHISEQGAESIQAAGQDISTALQMHFGVERRPRFYQKRIDHLFEQFEQFEENTPGITIESLTEQLSALENLLGKRDPDVETAARILESFKISFEE